MFFFKGVMEATSYSHLKIRQKRSGEKKQNKQKQTNLHTRTTTQEKRNPQSIEGHRYKTWGYIRV